jgi:hypothetical protein
MKRSYGVGSSSNSAVSVVLPSDVSRIPSLLRIGEYCLEGKSNFQSKERKLSDGLRTSRREELIGENVFVCYAVGISFEPRSP